MIALEDIELPKRDGAKVRVKHGPLGLELYAGWHRFAYKHEDADEWKYVGPATWRELCKSKEYTSVVDAALGVV